MSDQAIDAIACTVMVVALLIFAYMTIKRAE